MSFGIDTSQYQIGIDYFLARADGCEFAIAKAGGSNTGYQYVGSQYWNHIRGARASGMGVGHYWFNGWDNPVSDANFFVDNLYDYQLGDLIVLDVESEAYAYWNPDQCYDFAVTVHDRLGIWPVLYMSESVTRQNNWQPLVDLGCKIWVAKYSDNDPNIAYWTEWVLWQNTSSGNVAGVPGRVDVNQLGSTPFNKIHGDTPDIPVVVIPPRELEDMPLVYANAATNLWVIASPGKWDAIPAGWGNSYLKICNQPPNSPIICDDDNEFALARSIWMGYRQGDYRVYASIETNVWELIGPGVDYHIPPGQGDFWQSIYGERQAMHEADIQKIRDAFKTMAAQIDIDGIAKAIATEGKLAA